MDPKASAKSKRSHSQHGRSRHPTPSAPGSHKNKKPTPVNDSGQGSDTKPKPPRPSRPSLPSNWDRYDEDYELEGGQREMAATAEPQKKLEGGGDTVVVKSKGADFRYLIEQARSQPQHEALWNAAESERSASTVDAPDYLSGLSPMLLARGKSLFLSCGDDNFIVDDNATTSLEIPFLSLDLNALESQLAKLKASERLFVEPMYIPEELAELDETGKNPSLAPQSCDVREGSSATSDELVPESGSHPAWSDKGKETAPLANSGGDAEVGVGGDRGKAPSDPHRGSAMVKDARSSDVGAAKVELDALVDSLGEIEISSWPGSGGQLGSNSVKLVKPEPRIMSANLDLLPHSSNNLSLTSGGMEAADSIDSIDDLLSESRWVVPSHNSTLGRSNVGESSDRFGKSDVSVSARRFPGTPSLDDSIDDLLAEAPSFDVQKRSSSSREGARYSMKDSAASDSLSKALDDLDSLLDL